MKTRVGKLHCVDDHRVRVVAIDARNVLVAGEEFGGGWIKRSDLRMFRPWPKYKLALEGNGEKK